MPPILARASPFRFLTKNTRLVRLPASIYIATSAVSIVDGLSSLRPITTILVLKVRSVSSQDLSLSRRCVLAIRNRMNQVAETSHLQDRLSYFTPWSKWIMNPARSNLASPVTTCLCTTQVAVCSLGPSGYYSSEKDAGNLRSGYCGDPWLPLFSAVQCF